MYLLCTMEREIPPKTKRSWDRLQAPVEAKVDGGEVELLCASGLAQYNVASHFAIRIGRPRRDRLGSG